MEGPSHEAKLPIPKLPGINYSSSRSCGSEGNPSKVQKACTNCHKRKVKCSGGQPKCQSCLAQHITCSYPQGRRDRFQRVTEQNCELLAFLNDLAIRVDGDEQRKIHELLNSFRHDAPAPGVEKERFDDKDSGSTYDARDLMDEDLFRCRDSRATGFFGQNSEVQWLRSLRKQMNNPDASGPSAETSRQTTGGHVPHTTESNFYLDGEDLCVDTPVNPYELPSFDEAQRLFTCYMQTIHSSFPVLADSFEEQFQEYMESIKCGQPYKVTHSWQALLNLVLAIGAQYSHLIQAEWRAGENDHLTYAARATQHLGLNDWINTLSAPTISTIKATALLALYYLTIGHISRAWMTIGISLRFALAVGLHLRNDDPSARENKKDNQIRIWWSIHYIESHLSSLIGRPCIVPYNECTVPIPITLYEERSGTGIASQATNSALHKNGKSLLSTAASRYAVRNSFFSTRVALSLIMQKALSKLYLPRTFVDSWGRIQHEIVSLSKELDDWVSKAFPEGVLPAISVQESSGQREHLLLSFQYHSTRMLIHRPCLCHFDQRIQSEASSTFRQNSVRACIEAAQAVAALFPDDPNLAFIYQKTPWWCVVHNIMQAIAVLLLNMSLGQPQMTQPSVTKVESLRKLVQWLQCTSSSSSVARRAYSIVVDILKDHGLQLRVNLLDVLASPVVNLRPSFQIFQAPNNIQSLYFQENNLPETHV